MSERMRETCIYCKGDIYYTGLEKQVKCTLCGKTFEVMRFQSQQARLDKALEEGEQAKNALREAEAAKAKAQDRLNTALEALEGLEASQKSAEAELNRLFEQTRADRQTREAIAELLRGLRSGQERDQDALTRLMDTLAASQTETGDKLALLQSTAQKLLGAQNDVLARLHVQTEIVTTLQTMEMDAVKRQRLQNDFILWSQSIRKEDAARLRDIQSSTTALLAGQQALDDRVDDLRRAAAETQKTVDAFRSEYQADKYKALEQLYHQAENFQRDHIFDRAADAYREMLVKGCADVEVYWRLVLCHYCVEYQRDDAGDLIPTILNPDLSDPAELSERRDLLEHIGEEQSFYLDELARIDAVLDRYREVRHQMNFDVFISVKQRDRGHPTNDSMVGFRLYDYLTSKGLKVFNSEKKELLPAGHDYEPYIIAALMSAKVLIVVGTCAEYMNAQWVRNEWSRFQWLQREDKKRTGKTERLLLCYLSGGMQPREIPKALNPSRQAIVDSMEAVKQIDNALAFLMPEPNPAPQRERPFGTEETNARLGAILQQMTAWLYMGRFENVTKKYNELVDHGQFLDQARLHLRALCAQNQLTEIDQLAKLADLEQQPLFRLSQLMCRSDEDRQLLNRLLSLRPQPEPKSATQARPSVKADRKPSEDDLPQEEYLKKLLEALEKGNYPWVLRMYEKYSKEQPYCDNYMFHLYALCAERGISDVDALANSKKRLTEELKFLAARKVCTSRYAIGRLTKISRDNEDYIYQCEQREARERAQSKAREEADRKAQEEHFQRLAKEIEEKEKEQKRREEELQRKQQALEAEKQRRRAEPQKAQPKLPNAQQLSAFWRQNLPSVHNKAAVGPAMTPKLQKNALKAINAQLMNDETMVGLIFAKMGLGQGQVTLIATTQRFYLNVGEKIYPTIVADYLSIASAEAVPMNTNPKKRVFLISLKNGNTLSVSNPSNALKDTINFESLANTINSLVELINGV